MDYIHTMGILELSHHAGWLIFTKVPTDLFGQLLLHGYVLLVSRGGIFIFHNLVIVDIQLQIVLIKLKMPNFAIS